MKKIFLVVLFLVVCFINVMPSSAMSGRIEKIDMIYKTHSVSEDGSISYDRNSSYKLYVDDILTYCVSPGVLFKEGEGYYIDESYKIDPYRTHQMELISYYGYGYKNHTDIKYYLATQEMIHNLFGYGIVYNDGNFNVNDLKAEINELISKHNILPDITDNISIAKYTETLLIDNNNVLDEFAIEHSDNVRVEKVNNTLTVELLSGKSGEIRFYKGVDDSTKYYLKDNSQTVADFKLSKELMKTVTVTRKELGKIEVYDKDRATYEPIQGTTYDLLDSSFDVLETKTTDEDGHLIFDGSYEYGTYYVKEIEELNYKTNSDFVSVELESELVTAEFFHGELGSISVKNVDKYGNMLNGKFEITSSYPDSSFDDLMVGTYYIKQIEVDEGYIMDENTYEIKLTKDNLNQELVITNYQPIGSIVVKNQDEEGNDLTGKFEITDKDGKIMEFDNLDIGTYYVKQKEVAPGYIIDDTVYEVNIELDDLNKELIIVNKRQPEILPKTSSSRNYTFIISLVFILIGIVLRRIKYLEH